MDIIDIMLAKAMTPQGKTEAYVAKANKAARDAAQAAQSAAAAEASAENAVTTLENAQTTIASITSAAEDTLTEANNLLDRADVQYMAVQDTLRAAQQALDTAEQAEGTYLTINDVDERIQETYYSTNIDEQSNYNMVQLVTSYPDESENTTNILKMYNSAGVNEDGTMTQLAIKEYVDSHSGGSGGISNLGSQNAGHMVVVDENGDIAASTLTEEAITAALNGSTSPIIDNNDVIGLDIDYANKAFTRTGAAENLTMGNSFNQFNMYGGRIRCNVDDNGTITAFYGDSEYADDGSNGQVMIYQPKFYYKRTPVNLNGTIVQRETISISATPQTGFKLHPLFDDGEGGAYDYVLLSAYEGYVSNDELFSIAGEQPTGGLTYTSAEEYASNRGTGWHIMNMAAVSANQMLEIVEFGSMNGQNAIEQGICNLSNTSGINCSAITGSTAELGNAIGHATTTISKNNNTTITNTTDGSRAISYRGMENPWGNLWKIVGGILINGDSRSYGGRPSICLDYDYESSLDNYEYIGFTLPTSNSNFISNLGYGVEKYDWVLMPAATAGASTANSALPVGDSFYGVPNNSNTTIVAYGGTYAYSSGQNGAFYYACDTKLDTIKPLYTARLMYIPTKNNIYTSNITKWTNYIGG